MGSACHSTHHQKIVLCVTSIIRHLRIYRMQITHDISIQPPALYNQSGPDSALRWATHAISFAARRNLDTRQLSYPGGGMYKL